jgi:hypothetical protein
MKTETKTIKEWIETLPEQHRARALRNTPDANLNIRLPSLSLAIDHAFLWDKTPEGYAYWTAIHTDNYDAKPPAPIEEFTVEYQCGEMAWWTISTSNTEYIAHSEEDAEKLCEILNKNLAEERGEG